MPSARVEKASGLRAIAVLEPETSWLADAVVVAALVAIVASLVWYVRRCLAPMTAVVPISLAPSSIPAYMLLSLIRVVLSYVLSLIYTVVYGTIAAKSPRAEKVMIPVLDVLQGVPVLGFLPGVGLFFIHELFPRSNLGIEITCILMIFTAMPWNMAYSYFGSLRTIPEELESVARLHHFSWWQRFTKLELPVAMNGLIWNSMMSVAGGWFFLMILEVFPLRNFHTGVVEKFQLPGIGAYLANAYDASDWTAVTCALLAMAVVVVLIDQLVWKPLVIWAQRFRLQDPRMPRTWVGSLLARSRVVGEVKKAGVAVAAVWSLDAGPPGSPPPTWVAQVLSRSRVLRALRAARLGLASAWRTILPPRAEPRIPPRVAHAIRGAIGWIAAAAILLGTGWVGFKLARLIWELPVGRWPAILFALLLTTLRHFSAVLVAALVMVPLGIAIGITPRIARRAQPIVQVVASFPAPMFFPILTAAIVKLGGKWSFEWACVILTLFATQWYVLFNVIAGATAIPQDLAEAARAFRLGRIARWKTVFLPGVMPYLITGLFTSAGGAWNGAIVAEYQDNGNIAATGLGAMISRATDDGDYAMLAATVLVLVVTIILLNRFLWSPLHRKTDERFTITT